MYSPLTPPPPPPPLLPHHHQHIPSLLSSTTITRRSLLLSTSLSTLSPPRPTLDTTITDRVFLDFSICSNYFRPDRTLSDTFSTLCTDSTPLGRLVLGLYGHLVPLTVSNFKTMCTSYSYKNTLVHKIFPGQFFLAGRQGRREKGEVKVPQDLARNFESVDSKAFKLTHSGPGILSLCLSENDDEDNIKLNPEYRNVEFLITTGPGPCPQLDNKNIVFGVVLEALQKLLKELSSLNSQLSHCISKSRLNYLLQATVASGSRIGPDSTTLNSSSAPESEAAFNPCTTLPLVSGLPRVLGLPFPPSLPQIPGLPSVPGLPQIPRLPPTPPLPQIPGTLVNVIQCLTSVVNVPGCVVEITPLLNGQLRTVGKAFCKAFNSTNDICIQKMLALNPLFPSLLNDACGRTRGAPTAASAASKGSAGSEDRFA